MRQTCAARKYVWAVVVMIVVAGWAIRDLSAQVGLPDGRVVIGTDSDDFGVGVAVTDDGHVLATGSIGYPLQPLPLTPGVYQAPNTEYGGAYLAKLDKDALELLSIVAANSRGESVAIDGAGNLLVAGLTVDAGFTVTPGAVNAGPSAQPRAFVMKLSPDATSVLYSAILGPVVANPDVGMTRNESIAGPSLRLAVDRDGNAVVAGTAVSGFAVTPGAPDGVFAGGSEAFVAKLSADGSTLLYSTYLGGSGADEAHGLALDAAGNAVVSGTTASADFPATTNLHGGTDVPSAFVARVSADGRAIHFGTRVGGEVGAAGRGVALGPGGDIYLSGITRSTDFPSTAARFDTPWSVPRAEGFVMRLTPDGRAVVYSTSLADPTHLSTGSMDEIEQGSHMPISIAVDGQGRAIVVGTSGAGSHVMANRATSFRADVAADGSSFTAQLNARATDNGSASYDVTANAAGDIASVMTTRTYLDVTLVPTYGKDKEEIYPDPYWEGASNGMPADGMIDWSIAERAPADNTVVGSSVTVAATDNTASVTFGSVTAAGTTTVTPADPASLDLTMPGGFALSGLVQAIEIHTTATVSGIQVCMNAAALSDSEFAAASILHGVNGAWQIEPTTRDAATRTLCATVASLSPFAVGIHLDTTPPVISCGTATGWAAGPVAITCAAHDDSGLAAADASFTLTAQLADGLESASVPTNSRQVCDTAGNCATAGPVIVKIDRRPPAIQLTSPVARRYTLNESAAAAYGCTDGGSGIASCTGTTTSGGRVDTAAVGSHAFMVNAADSVGNASVASQTYTVGYDVKVLVAPGTIKRNSPATLAIQLVDANGANVSSAAVAVTAIALKQLSTGVIVAPAAWMPSTGASFLFGSASSTYGYGYQVMTKGLAPGTYELQYSAAGDSLIRTAQFTVR